MHLAHEIGVKLAKEMWGDRFEIIVTTHLDKEHIHCHFCFNSVSFRDGGKYNYSKAERKRMMEISDRLCREYDLSVIEMSHKAPSVRYGWMRKAASLPATMSTVPMSGRQWSSAEHPTIWRIICGARDISPTSQASTGNSACHNMNTS